MIGEAIKYGLKAALAVLISAIILGGYKLTGTGDHTIPILFQSFRFLIVGFFFGFLINLSFGYIATKVKK